MVTLKDVAAKCGVSIATVSNILNGKSNVSNETKERILEVIKEMGYTPNVMAQGLRAQKTRTIGVIVEDINLFSTPGIIDGILLACQTNKYRAIIENLRLYSQDEGRGLTDKIEYHKLVDPLVQQMLALKVDGLIYLAGHDRAIDCFRDDLPVPAVYAYAHSANKKYPSIYIDDITSTHDIFQYLIDKGHTKFAVVEGAPDNNHTIKRREGLKEILAKNNLVYDEKAAECGYWMRESGYEACKRLFEKKVAGEINFTAIFCHNDVMAAGVYDYCYENDIVPGRDITVVGFDDNVIARFMKPMLTTSAIHLRLIGIRATEMVINKIDDAEAVIDDVSIPCLLIERDSVVKIK